MHFIYVMREEDKDKMVQLGYKLYREDAANHVFIFHTKNPTVDLTFADDDDDLAKAGIPHVVSNILTF